MTSRREFLAGGSLMLLGAALPISAQPAVPRPNRATGLVEATTRSGRVRGMQSGGLVTFVGIPYGASTAGRNRFMPPRSPTPWRGARDCVARGQICPQATAPGLNDNASARLGALQARMGEDCLNLDLWTPALKDGARRPVLVSVRGEVAAGVADDDGAQLALHGDVVVISVNHRVGPLGFFQLADLGGPASFARAGVAGLMDLTAALEWVRDHAEIFGGDPGNVMIFGQSGGGVRVSGLLATRAARGLFHRAAVQSGSLLRFEPRAQATEQAARLLRALDADRAPVAALQDVPWQRLLEVQTRGAPWVGTRPVLDGEYLTHHPFDPVAPEESATVPLLVSTALEDAAASLTNFSIGEDQLRTILDERFSAHGSAVLALYRRYYPQLSPFLVQAQAFTDAGVRYEALRQAELKSLQGKGAIYVYEWDWSGPAFGSRSGAVRGLGAASLGNACEGTDLPRLAGQWSAAWIEFARTGTPASPLLPPWPGYDVTTRATMVFGTPTRMVNDHRGEIRQFWQQPHSPAGA